MTEIAAEMGLSRVAVSCAMNGKGRRLGLSEKTIQRVREHLDRRGYVPSRAARQLHKRPACVVGLLHVDILFTHLIDAFHRLAQNFGAAGVDLEVMITPRDRVKAAVQEMLSRRVTNLVWIHNSRAGEEYRNKDIASYLANMRTIVYNFPFNSPAGCDDLLGRGFALVGVDRLAHISRLARFLRRLGHRVIALPDVSRTGHRIGYHEAFESEGLVVAECPPPFRVDRFIKAMRQYKITAACFHGDNPASLAMSELRAAGVRVPEDLTVTGFDGLSRQFNRDLTTLSIPTDKMVAKVQEIVAGTERELRHCFDMELIKGRTHGPPGRVSLPKAEGEDRR